MRRREFKIMSKLVIDDNGCWRWTGAHTDSSYGYFTEDRKRVRVHRYVWELSQGPIGYKLEIDHLCRIRDCANPAHLEPVTHRVNMSRGAHALKTHCPAGHEYTAANTWTSAKDAGRRCRICHAAKERETHRRAAR